jgi:hypothetical protein
MFIAMNSTVIGENVFIAAARLENSLKETVGGGGGEGF